MAEQIATLDSVDNPGSSAVQPSHSAESKQDEALPNHGRDSHAMAGCLGWDAGAPWHDRPWLPGIGALMPTWRLVAAILEPLFHQVHYSQHLPTCSILLQCWIMNSFICMYAARLVPQLICLRLASTMCRPLQACHIPFLLPIFIARQLCKPGTQGTTRRMLQA